MKRITKSIGLLIFFSSSLLVTAQNSSVLDGQSFKTLTEKGDWNHSKRVIIIHPTTTIDYNDYFSISKKRMFQKEDSLKTEYDIIKVNISISDYRDDRNKLFSIYEAKRNAILYTDSTIQKAIDFYDFEISSSGHAYFDSKTYDYEASTTAYIKGYLLFPKSITPETKTVMLEFAGDTYEWNYQKIEQLVNLLKE